VVRIEMLDQDESHAVPGGQRARNVRQASSPPPMLDSDDRERALPARRGRLRLGALARSRSGHFGLRWGLGRI
jgi:hypothetical protein